MLIDSFDFSLHLWESTVTRDYVYSSAIEPCRQPSAVGWGRFHPAASCQRGVVFKELKDSQHSLQAWRWPPRSCRPSRCRRQWCPRSHWSAARRRPAPASSAARPPSPSCRPTETASAAARARRRSSPGTAAAPSEERSTSRQNRARAETTARLQLWIWSHPWTRRRAV